MYPFDVRISLRWKAFEDNESFFFLLAALRIEKGLKDVDTFEEEDVNIEVVLSKPSARGKWMKDGKILYPDQKYEREKFRSMR